VNDYIREQLWLHNTSNVLFVYVCVRASLSLTCHAGLLFVSPAQLDTHRMMQACNICLV
jgi:hypothetical protein